MKPKHDTSKKWYVHATKKQHEKYKKAFILLKKYNIHFVERK
jgi:hypothetical protein